MKKIILIFFLSLLLISCETTTSSTAADVIIEAIDIIYETGDSIQNITQDITLITSTNLNDDAVITWESLNEKVISSGGVVTRQTEDVSVRLIVRVNLNGLYAQKIFDVIVKAIEVNPFITVTVHVFENTQTYTLTESTPISTLNTPMIEGYVFLGWIDENDQLIDTSFIINASIEITASFEAIVTIQYTINVYQQSLDETYELINSTEFQGIAGETVHYITTYEGFHLTSESVTEIMLSETSTVLDLYFDRNTYDVIFYNQGTVYQVQTYAYGDVIIEPFLNSEVIGWSLVDQGSAFDFQTLVTEDINLYALYDEPEITYSGYYASLDGVSDTSLYSVLETLIQSYTYVDYGAARDILQISDEDPSNSNNIILVYNRASVLSTWDGGATWNREHVWPRSLLENSTAEDDPHNLKPADPVINSTRGNDQFVSGTGVYGRVSGGWFPGEEDQGDVARIVMYVALMWEKNLSIIGNVNTILQWHRDDPVDAFEMNRNEVLFEYTDHRNPYIDHPELAYRIYGQPSNVPFYLMSSDQGYQRYLVLSIEIWIEKNTSL